MTSKTSFFRNHSFSSVRTSTISNRKIRWTEKIKKHNMKSKKHESYENMKKKMNHNEDHTDRKKNYVLDWIKTFLWRN